MHSRVHRSLRVLTCVANDLLVWKNLLVCPAGATFTIWKDQFSTILILRHCWHLHTRLGCCRRSDPDLLQSWSVWRRRNRWVHSLNQLLDKLGLITRKLEGSKALPFVHILQYKGERIR